MFYLFPIDFQLVTYKKQLKHSFSALSHKEAVNVPVLDEFSIYNFVVLQHCL